MGRWGPKVLFVAVAVLAAGSALPPASADGVALPPAAPGAWRANPAPPDSANEMPLFALDDGGALSIGARWPGWWSSGFPVFKAQRWSAETSSWSLAANPAIPREAASGTKLADGRILLIGGGRVDDKVTDYLASTEIFDPATDSWSAGPTMSQARRLASATTLPDGTVMVAGGAYPNTVEILDVAAGTSRGIAAPADGEYTGHIAVVGDGRFVFGATGHLYDIAAETWSLVPGPTASAAARSSVVLPDGRFLTINQDWSAPRDRRIEIFDPDSRVWSYGPPTLANRYSGDLVLMSGARLLAVSGRSGELTAETLDLGDMAAGWSPVAAPALATPTGYYDRYRLVALGGGGALMASFESPLGATVFDPSVPAAPYAFSLSTTPSSSTDDVGGYVRFTLTLRESTTATALENVALLGGVTSGPNQGGGYCVVNWSQAGPCVTARGGQIDFQLPGTGGPGTDTIEFTADVDGDGVAGEGEPVATMTAQWNRLYTQLGAAAAIDRDQDRVFSTVDPALGQMRARLTRIEPGDYGSYNVPIAGKEVRFTVGASAACSAITDSFGWATCATPPNLVEVARANGYNAYFDGDPVYLDSRANGRLVRV